MVFPLKKRKYIKFIKKLLQIVIIILFYKHSKLKEKKNKNKHQEIANKRYNDYKSR